MKTTTILALASTFTLASGCASTGVGLPGRDGKLPSSPSVDVDPDPDPDVARPQFPDRISAIELPAIDRIAHRVHSEHAGALAARLRLCVAPAGQVSGVELLASSGMAEYDQAVVEAASDWQYAAYAAPDDTRVCGDLTVGYRAPR